MACRARRSPDAHLPEVAGAHRRQHRHAPVEDGAQRADVALGAVGLPAVDRELPGRARRASTSGTRRRAARAPACRASARTRRAMAARRSSATRKRTSHAAAWATRIAPSSVARTSPAMSSKRGAPRAPPRRGRARAPRRPRARPGSTSVRAPRFGSPADDPLDAHLDHAIARGVEAGHLEVDERQRRLGDGQIPRRPGGGRGHGRELTVTTRGRAPRPSSRRPGGRPGSRRSGAGRRGRRRRRPARASTPRPTRRARSCPRSHVRYSRVPGVWGTPVEARPRGQLHAVDLHAGDGIGQELADR